jgi:hypothetical protein
MSESGEGLNIFGRKILGFCSLLQSRVNPNFLKILVDFGVSKTCSPTGQNAVIGKTPYSRRVNRTKPPT